ncbi:MAG: acylneuraminate cytidylyltransferase [Candidatus Omnitrophica bacterium]|nr:acylneuraminate cytidylyltransferase [Candidatus Omnitrophota bacterium]
MNVLVVIPARGGSKGIPRKNLRTLAGKPLLYYSIQTALHSKYKPDVFVSSDDDEILMVARKCGAQTHQRDVTLADDKTTLDPVIYDASKAISAQTGKSYDFVVTMQPTSPLLKAASLDAALEQFMANPECESMISAKKEAHLSWKTENGKYVPNYKERVNRQYLDPFFPETGSFVICRSAFLNAYKKRIGIKVDLYVLPSQEAIDIDTYEDWNLCEYLLKRRTILFVLSGYNEIGLGHIYRGLVLANSILNHRVLFLVDEKSQLGYDKIKESNYDVHIQTSPNIIDDIMAFDPDVIINDVLDTTDEYMKSLKNLGLKLINFEDLGPGVKHADIVINALYPERDSLPNHYFGHLYFCPRDEFLISEFKTVTKDVRRVLITMGGVDPCNLTAKVLSVIYPYCMERGIAIDLVLGLGYQRTDTLKSFPQAKVHRDIKTMSDFMLAADVILTSAGRTVYEAASIGTPTIVLAQNEREMTHFFASPKYGFTNLGLGKDVKEADILKAFEKLVSDFDFRYRSHELMLSGNIREGKIRVINLIQSLIGA